MLMKLWEPGVILERTMLRAMVSRRPLELGNTGVAPGCNKAGAVGWEAQVGGVKRAQSFPQGIRAFRRYAHLTEHAAVMHFVHRAD